MKVFALYTSIYTVVGGGGAKELSRKLSPNLAENLAINLSVTLLFDFTKIASFHQKYREKSLDRSQNREKITQTLLLDLLGPSGYFS